MKDLLFIIKEGAAVALVSLAGGAVCGIVMAAAGFTLYFAFSI